MMDCAYDGDSIEEHVGEWQYMYVFGDMSSEYASLAAQAQERVGMLGTFPFLKQSKCLGGSVGFAVDDGGAVHDDSP